MQGRNQDAKDENERVANENIRMSEDLKTALNEKRHAEMERERAEKERRDVEEDAERSEEERRRALEWKAAAESEKLQATEENRRLEAENLRISEERRKAQEVSRDSPSDHRFHSSQQSRSDSTKRLKSGGSFSIPRSRACTVSCTLETRYTL